MSLDAVSVGGRYCVLAIDHRDSLRAFVAPDDPSSVPGSDLTALKIDLVAGLADLATGVMLEPEYSIPEVLEAGVLPANVGFIAALESQGYLDDPGAEPTSVLAGWSPAAARACGAAAAKLLLPYHPDRPLAEAQERLAVAVASECREAGLPLVLEPLFFDLDDPTDRPRVVLETAGRFAGVGADLLKLPFPVDPLTGDPGSWAGVCSEVSSSTGVPWTLLSGGGTYLSFVDQLRVALDAGCAGCMVGRALWGEAARAQPAERQAVIERLVRPRLAELSELIVSAPTTKLR